MPDDNSERIERAQPPAARELSSLIHETDEKTLLALLENPGIAEPLVIQMLERLDLSANVLAAIAEKGKWTASEGVRLRLARHPHTPRRLAMALLRQLYLFDLVRLSLLPATPAEIKRVAEELIVTLVPHLPVGQKLTLARRGPSRVVGALLAEGHPQAIKLALANAFLTESQILGLRSQPFRNASSQRSRNIPSGQSSTIFVCGAGSQASYSPFRWCWRFCPISPCVI